MTKKKWKLRCVRRENKKKKWKRERENRVFLPQVEKGKRAAAPLCLWGEKGLNLKKKKKQRGAGRRWIAFETSNRREKALSAVVDASPQSRSRKNSSVPLTPWSAPRGLRQVLRWMIRETTAAMCCRQVPCQTKKKKERRSEPKEKRGKKNEKKKTPKV